MAKKLKLKIITPEKLVFEEEVNQVTFPSTEGELTVLPDHIPLIAGLASGDVVAVTNGEHIPMAVAGGFVEVHPVRSLSRGGTAGASEHQTSNGVKEEKYTTEVVIMADFAEHVSELSEAAIEKAKARAEELRKQMENKEVVDYEHFAAELERSLTRVKISDKWRTKKYRK
ncbi:MAG: hypothetical protein HYV67_02510 [Candidatus Taylorbacteria bacterium]|nr:hypothetical protein [Candidatus Taylorbacteria bacterium]